MARKAPVRRVLALALRLQMHLISSLPHLPRHERANFSVPSDVCSGLIRPGSEERIGSAAVVQLGNNWLN